MDSLSWFGFFFGIWSSLSGLLLCFSCQCFASKCWKFITFHLSKNSWSFGAHSLLSFLFRNSKMWEEENSFPVRYRTDTGTILLYYCITRLNFAITHPLSQSGSLWWWFSQIEYNKRIVHLLCLQWKKDFKGKQERKMRWISRWEIHRTIRAFITMEWLIRLLMDTRVLPTGGCDG